MGNNVWQTIGLFFALCLAFSLLHHIVGWTFRILVFLVIAGGVIFCLYEIVHFGTQYFPLISNRFRL